MKRSKPHDVMSVREVLSSAEARDVLTKVLAPVASALQVAELQRDELIAQLSDAKTLPELATFLENHPPPPLVVAMVFWRAKELGISQHQAEKSAQKNKQERAFVVDQWENRESQDQQIRAFAREMRSRLHRMFKSDVKQETIEGWLRSHRKKDAS